MGISLKRMIWLWALWLMPVLLAGAGESAPDAAQPRLASPTPSVVDPATADSNRKLAGPLAVEIVSSSTNPNHFVLFPRLREFLATGRLDISWLPENWRNLANFPVFGQEGWRIILAGFNLLFVFVLNRLIRRYLMALYKRSEQRRKAKELDDSGFVGMSALAVRRGASFFLWAAGGALSLAMIAPQAVLQCAWLSHAIFLTAIGVLLYDYVEVIDYYVQAGLQKTSIRVDNTLIPLMRRILRLLVVLGIGLHLYHVVSGNSITTVVAGLGIGGMAVALAATDTIKNFIGFIMILFDKPFTVGDRIVFDGHDGVVEYVGLRTTRMRRLDSAQVSIPNSKAVDSVVHNIGRRRYLKRTLTLGLVYSTTPQQMTQALAIIRDILSGHEANSPEFPPRVYFTEFKDDNLSVEITYWYCSTDWWAFCAFNERVNLDLLTALNDAGIQMAFPTRTVILSSGDGASLR